MPHDVGLGVSVKEEKRRTLSAVDEMDGGAVGVDPGAGESVEHGPHFRRIFSHMERRLSCRRLGGWSGDFLVADWGGGAATFLSPIGGKRGLEVPLYSPEQATGKSPSQRATGKSPLPAGDRKVATPRGDRKVATPVGDRKSPLPVGDRKVATPSGRQEVATPSGRQESRHSRWATGKSPLPVGDRKVATPSRATGKSPLPVGDRKVATPGWATGKSPLPVGDRKVATPGGRQKVATPGGRQESRHSRWATGKSPLPVGDTPGGRQESRHSYSSSRCGGPSQTSSGWAFHHSSRACSWGARHPS